MMEMNKNKTELCILFENYKSDKCPAINHTYSPLYFDLLSEIKYSATNVLEIGIGNINLMKGIVGEDYSAGASIRAWRDFFPNAMIYTVDILEDVLFEEDRIKSYQMDQSSHESINKFLEIISTNNNNPIDFDFIIDDGSHKIDHMIISAYEFSKSLKSGGIYIIEDVQEKYLPALLDVEFKELEVFNIYRGNTEWDNFIAYKKR